ncbi:MAG: glycosyltransferase family 2 protein [Deltaproteobacteria bacterium]|nr:MAG: glycosyltransferase family 2 protein [Deltaproteobacteria bacterium]
MRIDVVIPALDEEASLPLVLADLARIRDRVPWRRIVVVDNGSRDRTAEVARQMGAEVLHEPRRGYGSACLTGLAHLYPDPPDTVVFLDGDHADHVEDLPLLLQPIREGQADLVIGSRTAGAAEPGALLPQARFGNWLACRLIEALYDHRYTDLGPFRALRWEALERLEMRDDGFGWTVEMQMKALERGLAVVEVPVRYRRRVGRSKISGTVRGTVLAGAKILWTIGRHGWRRRWRG